MRIVCMSIIQNEIVILHIFKKKSNKTSTKDLQFSAKRYKSELDNGYLKRYHDYI